MRSQRKESINVIRNVVGRLKETLKEGTRAIVTPTTLIINARKLDVVSNADAVITMQKTKNE